MGGWFNLEGIDSDFGVPSDGTYSEVVNFDSGSAGRVIIILAGLLMALSGIAGGCVASLDSESRFTQLKPLGIYLQSRVCKSLSLLEIKNRRIK